MAERQDELLITRGADAAFTRAVQRRARAGELARVAPGIYLREFAPERQAPAIRRHWASVVAALMPGAVVSYRSAMAGGMDKDGRVTVSHPTRFNRTIRLPGLVIAVVKGPGPLPGDMPIHARSLFIASRPRQFLENLGAARNDSGRSAGLPVVEARLVEILSIAGDAELNRIRDQAREIAPALLMDRALQKLDSIIGALLSTRPRRALTTAAGQFAAAGTPVDESRIRRFEVLAQALRGAVLAHREPVAALEPARSHFAFLESYFSNYVEGTEFGIEEARDIALSGRIIARRPADSHDILGVFRMALESPWRDTVPPAGADFPGELARRHAQMLAARPESHPGEFKTTPNRAGNTWFVEPPMVRGTLGQGASIALSVPEGFDYANVERVIAEVVATNALERSRVEFKLTMPGGGALGSLSQM